MGVYFNKSLGRYHVRRYIRGKNHHIGYFYSKEEAIANDRDWSPPFEDHDVIVEKIKPTKFASWTPKEFKEESRRQISELSKKYAPKFNNANVAVGH